ncbi:MAG: PAS/PAC sensor signal transduction histidine kinase [Parcubacteria group bacterium GW2011_GWA2_47_7]|nr:MAG: PAS/PAC sensor signal transduction histidine kinase [Parcubacteria group bacterium GW2011_GWA2_47_7]
MGNNQIEKIGHATQADTNSDLRESEIRLRQLFLSSKDALMTLEPPTWQFTSGNPSALSMFGANNELDFTSAEPWRLSPEKQPDGRLSSDKAKEAIEIAMRDGSNFFEWTHRRLTGEDFFATVLLTKVQIKEYAFLQATVRDISQQKKIENQLRENEEKYRLLTEMSPDCIKLLDLEGNILYINKAGVTEHSLGNEKDKKDFKLTDSIIENDKSKFIDAFEQAKKGIISVLEIQHTKEGSNRETCLETFQPITGSDGIISSIFVVGKDLTSIKHSSDELQNKVNELEKMNTFMMGRELRIIELKNEIKKLSETNIQKQVS